MDTATKDTESSQGNSKSQTPCQDAAAAQDTIEAHTDHHEAHLKCIVAALAVCGLILCLSGGSASAFPKDAATDTPTAGALLADFNEVLATDAVLSTKSGQRLVLTALLCEATELLTSEATHTTAAGRMRLASQVEASRERLAVLAIEPLACDSWSVARLVQCLGILPSISCTEDDELHVQVQAAERLQTRRP